MAEMATRPAESATESPLCAACGETATLRCPCKSVRYCSRACQKTSWRGHKAACHELRSRAPPRHARWFEQSPRELGEQCLAFMLRARAKAEGLRETDAPERTARQVMADPNVGDAGPGQLGRAIDGARELFGGKVDALPERGTPEGDRLQERVADVTHHLVQGARALVSDEAFEPFVRDWVRHLFDPAVLLGTVAK